MVISWVASGYCRRCRWLPPDVTRERQSMLRSCRERTYMHEQINSVDVIFLT